MESLLFNAEIELHKWENFTFRSVSHMNNSWNTMWLVLQGIPIINVSVQKHRGKHNTTWARTAIDITLIMLLYLPSKVMLKI